MVATNKMNSEKAAGLLQNMAEAFSQTKFPEMCAKVMINAPDEIPSSSWSLGNRMLMFLSGTTDARGYRQWSKVYRNVKKGSKAVYILVPMQKKIKDKKTDEDKMITVGFRGMPVFRYEDTEGTQLEEYEPKVLPPLFHLAEKNGIDVTWQKSERGEYASVDVNSNEITLSTEAPDSFLHELVHWYDNKNVKLKPVQDPEQETVAQLGACVLAKMYGYDVERYTWNYIAGYANTKNPQEVGQMCFKVLGRVQKAINAILEDAEKTALKEIQPMEAVN